MKIKTGGGGDRQTENERGIRRKNRKEERKLEWKYRDKPREF